MAVYLTNSFEGGTNGTTVTQGSGGNTGGNSGNYFDLINIGAASTLAFSNTEAAHGTLSCKLTQPASAVSTTFAWTASLTSSSIPTVYFRTYLWYPSLPSAGVRVISCLNGATFLGAVQLGTTGKLTAINAAGSAIIFTGNGIASTTNALNTGAWSRVEGFFTGSATVGQISVSIYNTPDSTTATETEATAANLNTAAAVTNLRFGDPGAAPNFAIYFDDVGGSDTGYVGPAQFSGSASAALTLAATAAGGPVTPHTAKGFPIVPVLTAADLFD